MPVWCWALHSHILKATVNYTSPIFLLMCLVEKTGEMGEKQHGEHAKLIQLPKFSIEPGAWRDETKTLPAVPLCCQ